MAPGPDVLRLTTLSYTWRQYGTGYTWPGCITPGLGGLHLAWLCYTWRWGIPTNRDVSQLATMPCVTLTPDGLHQGYT